VPATKQRNDAMIGMIVKTKATKTLH